MKNSAILFFLLMSAFSSAFPADKLVSISRIPANTEEFVYMRNVQSNTPEGGAAMFIMSLIIYTNDKNLGMQCATIALDQSRLTAGSTYKGFTPDNEAARLISAISEKTKLFIPYSYIVKTSPDRDYKAVLPFTFSFKDMPNNLHSENEAKVFAVSSGDQTPRAVYMKKNDKGIWKVVKFDGLMKDVIQPVHKKTDDL